MRVTRLTVAPVKGLQVINPSQVTVTPTGILGDRMFFLVDAAGALRSAQQTGAFLGLVPEYSPGREWLSLTGTRTLAGPVTLGEPVTVNFYGLHDVAAHEVTGPWSALFSELAGEPVRLLRADAPNDACDVRPLTLLGAASIAELTARASLMSVDARRFRMSIEFDGAPAHAEDGWEGSTLRVGSAVVRVGGAVPRCAATTRNPHSGDADLKTLHLIKDYRGVTVGALGKGIHFGVYADVVEPGVIHVGDPLVPA